MLCLGKRFVLVLVCGLVLSGVLLVESVVAPVTVPSNPSAAPEIVSVIFHHNPIWRPPVYSTNSYTGEVTEVTRGYWRPNGTVDITIKNRSFTPYIDTNGNYVNVYYTFFTQSSHLGIPWDIFDRPSYAVYQSSSNYTIFTLRYDDSFSKGQDQLSASTEGASYDFRVQAVIGYFQGSPPFINAVFEGEGSEWVDFTIKIPVSNKSGTSSVKPSSSSHLGPSSSLDTSGSLFQNPWVHTLILIVVVCIIVIPLVVIAYLLYGQRKVRCVGVAVDDVGCGVEAG